MAPNTSAAYDPKGRAFAEDESLDRVVWGARFLQPQTLGSIIRNTFNIYWRGLGTVGLIYILPLLPVAVLSAVLEARHYIVWALVFNLIQVLGTVLVGAALIIAVSDICIGLKPNLRRAYRRGFANGRLLGTYFLAVLFLSIGLLLFVIPFFVLSAWYMFALPATVLEQFGGRAALRRSRELGRGFYWRNFGITLANGFLAFFLLLVLLVPIFLLEQFLLGGRYPMFEGVVNQTFSIVLVGPLFSIPLVLLYYDMRARKDGYGVAQLAEDVRI
jgi:hypothetical protein